MENKNYVTFSHRLSGNYEAIYIDSMTDFLYHSGNTSIDKELFITNSDFWEENDRCKLLPQEVIWLIKDPKAVIKRKLFKNGLLYTKVDSDVYHDVKFNFAIPDYWLYKFPRTDICVLLGDNYDYDDYEFNQHFRTLTEGERFFEESDQLKLCFDKDRSAYNDGVEYDYELRLESNYELKETILREIISDEVDENDDYLRGFQDGYTKAKEKYNK